jgi:hypothetical protein
MGCSSSTATRVSSCTTGPQPAASRQSASANTVKKWVGPDAGSGQTKPSTVLLQVFALSGESVFGPEQVSSAKTIRRIVELLDPTKSASPQCKRPQGVADHKFVLLHGVVPLYDIEQNLASLLHDGATDEVVSLDLSMIRRRQLQKGDHVIVHEDIENANLKSGQRGRVCKILLDDPHGLQGLKLSSKAKKDDDLFGNCDVLISLLNGSSVGVLKNDVFKLHIDHEHLQSR